MRRVLRLPLVTVIVIAAVTAVVSAAMAFSAASTPTPAYAVVNPNGGSPVFLTARTHGFASVTVGPFGPGDYCLQPSAGVSVLPGAVASMEAFTSTDLGIVSVRYPKSGPMCPTGDLEVKTFALDGSGLDAGVGFSVYVP